MKKYLIVAKAVGTDDGFVPADFLCDSKLDADFEAQKHRGFLNGEPEWPVHSVAEVLIGPTLQDLMEAAMCLWEAVVSWESELWDQSNGEWVRDLEGNEWAYTQYREWTGTANMRPMMADFAEPCHEAWLLAHRGGEGFDDPFDWEFVPWFVRNCIEWDATHGPSLRKDWRERASKLGEKSGG